MKYNVFVDNQFKFESDSYKEADDEFNAHLSKYPKRYIDLTDEDGNTIYSNHGHYGDQRGNLERHSGV